MSVKRALITVLSSIIVLLLIISKLYWILVEVVFIVGVLFILIRIWRKGHILLFRLLLLFSIIFTSLIIRVFYIEIYKVPGASMENTILPGDRIIMNKLAYGPILPNSSSEVPILNIFYYFFSSKRFPNDSAQRVYKRFKGFGDIRVGDIVMFKLNKGSNETYIKRCIALPDDVLQITGSKVYVNGYLQSYPSTIKSDYPVSALDLKCSTGNGYSTEIENAGTTVFKKDGQNPEEKFFFAYNTKPLSFVHRLGGSWPVDSFGPITIPKKSGKITLDQIGVAFYRDFIVGGDEMIFEEALCDTAAKNAENKFVYTFQNDCFFFLGDNRLNSVDSRSFGVIPERFIIGKVNRVFYSKKEGRFHFSRVFKRIE